MCLGKCRRKSRRRIKGGSEMRRLTSDDPTGIFETVMNMICGIDGWQHIRHDGGWTPTTDFCLSLCARYGCDVSSIVAHGSQEEKDQMLCDCVFVDCPIATVYAVLSGYGHLRDRLKMYEDTGLMPDEICAHTENAECREDKDVETCSINGASCCECVPGAPCARKAEGK